MKLVILAAGRGRRLGTLTDHLPKPLMPVSGDKTILDHALEGVIRSGCFDGVVVITGYKEALIRERLERYRADLRIETCHNREYTDTSPLYSLYIAREHMRKDDFVVVNGDTLYDSSVFSMLKEVPAGFHLFVTRTRQFAADDVKVVEKNGEVLQTGKNISAELACGISAGMLSVRGQECRQQVCDVIREMHERHQSQKAIWHELINRIIERGQSVRVVPVEREQWKEIDTETEYHMLLQAGEWETSGFSNH